MSDELGWVENLLTRRWVKKTLQLDPHTLVITYPIKESFWINLFSICKANMGMIRPQLESKETRHQSINWRKVNSYLFEELREETTQAA